MGCPILSEVECQLEINFFLQGQNEFWKILMKFLEYIKVFTNLEKHNILLKSLTFFACIFHRFKITVSD